MAGFCAQCGTARRDDALFCTKCGADLGAQDQSLTRTDSVRVDQSRLDGRNSADANSRTHTFRPNTAIVSLAMLAVVALLAIAILPGLFNATPEQVLAGPASLDAGFPEFPLPPGGTLLNATSQGSSATAYRAAAWASPLDYGSTVAFYSDLSDLRWQLEQNFSAATGASFLFADAEAAYDHAAVSIAPTSPVRIDVALVPTGGAAAPTIYLEGSPLVYGPLPTQSGLPERFPTQLTPPSATLLDAASEAEVTAASWASSDNASAVTAFYLSQLADADPTVADSDGVTTIDFAGSLGEGTVTIASTQDGTMIYVEIHV